MMEPSEKTNRLPTRSIAMIIGSSQNFFLNFKNSQISFNENILYSIKIAESLILGEAQ